MNALEAKMAELAARFATRAAGDRRDIAEALDSGNRDLVRERAHKLAGIAPMLGQRLIGEAALELELAAETGEGMGAAAERLDALLAALVEKA